MTLPFRGPPSMPVRCCAGQITAVQAAGWGWGCAASLQRSIPRGTRLVGHFQDVRRAMSAAAPPQGPGHHPGAAPASPSPCSECVWAGRSHFSFSSGAGAPGHSPPLWGDLTRHLSVICTVSHPCTVPWDHRALSRTPPPPGLLRLPGWVHPRVPVSPTALPSRLQSGDGPKSKALLPRSQKLCQKPLGREEHPHPRAALCWVGACWSL